jgi:hypothetical protein
MVGDELDLGIIAAGLSPSDFLGATLPTPPPPPLPTPLPSPPAARTPSPPPIAVLETEESSLAPPPMPPPAHKKRPKARRAPAYHPQTSGRSASQPEGRKPPVIRIPSARARSSAGRDPSRYPRAFPAERFRPKGVVVRTFFPPCKYCNNNGRLCTLEAGYLLSTKTPRCCSPCKVAHISCPGWTKFSNAYEDGDDEILSEFLVLLWEHLGDGSFSPLQPDPWWSDLPQTRAYFFCFPRSDSFHQHLFFLLGLSTTYREFLLLRPKSRATGSSTHRSSAASVSDSGAETSESEIPAHKRRKMSRPQSTRCTPCPEVVEVTDKDDAPAAADDPRNYNFELEPAPDAVPPWNSKCCPPG